MDPGQAPVLYAAGCVGDVNPCSGANRQAQKPPDRPAARRRFGGRHRHDRAEHGQHAERPVPVRRRHHQDDLHLSEPRRRAAVRHGLRPERASRRSCCAAAAACSSTVRTATTSTPRSPIHRRSRTSPCATRSCRRSAAGCPPSARPRSTSTSTTPSCPRPGSGTAACRWRCRGRSALDVAYTGQHSWNTPQAVNINAVDFGAAFLPQNQDPTLAASATPGASAVAPDLMRGYLGYGSITRRMSTLWRTFHGINLSFQRRFTNGVAFGFNDSITLYDHQNSNARLQHAADGSFSYRADQEEADALFQTDPVVHIMKANFIWDLPDMNEQPAPRFARPRRDRQRLAAVGHLDGQHQRALPDRLQLPERRQQREPDRLARTMPRASASSAIPAPAAATTSTASSTPPRSRARSSTASASNPATTTSRAVSRACSTCRSRGTSG